MKVARIGELAQQIRGVTFAKGDTSPTAQDGFTPVLRAGNIDDGRLTFDDMVYVPESKVKLSQRVQRDDVVIAASSGSLHVVGKAARCDLDFDGTFGAFLKVLRPGPEVDPQYFAHYFQTPRYRSIISSLATGANINNLKNEHLNDLEILLPPIDEQRRIAAILDKADAIRQKRRQAIAHLDTLTQSIFHEMFQTNESREWPVAQIGEVSDSILGKMLDKKRSDQLPQHPYIRNANVQWFRIDLTDVSSMGFHDSELKKYSLQRGDVLMCEGGEPGRCAIWPSDDSGMKFQKAVHRIRLGDELLPEYFVRYFKELTQGGGLKDYASTSTISHLTAAKLKTIPISIPPIELQKQFATVANSFHDQAESLTKAISLHDSLFSSLQSRAFRGEL